MSIADNIKKIRIQYDLTQAELGEIAGVSDKAVWTWENGMAEPRMGAIQKIADHLGITKGSIVDDSSDSYLTPAEAAILSGYRQLNAEGQEKIADYISDLVASGRYIKSRQDGMVGA